MGQHKHNPVAIAAAEGKLAPKKSNNMPASSHYAFVIKRLREMFPSMPVFDVYNEARKITQSDPNIEALEVIDKVKRRFEDGKEY